MRNRGVFARSTQSCQGAFTQRKVTEKVVWGDMPRHGREDQAREQLLCLKIKGINWKIRNLKRNGDSGFCTKACQRLRRGQKFLKCSFSKIGMSEKCAVVSVMITQLQVTETQFKAGAWKKSALARGGLRVAWLWASWIQELQQGQSLPSLC